MTEALKQTPLHSVHVAAGAKMVDFAGWSMPIEYAGVVGEHQAVRTSAGIFDVSHMKLFFQTKCKINLMSAPWILQNG